jgi:hypothetical protein
MAERTKATVLKTVFRLPLASNLRHAVGEMTRQGAPMRHMRRFRGAAQIGARMARGVA